MQHATVPIGLRSGYSLGSLAVAIERLVYPLVVGTVSFVYIHSLPKMPLAHLRSRTGLLRHGLCFQMEACVMSTDTPGHALTRRAVLGAPIVDLGAALVPKLVTSTEANGGIAVIARSGRERTSRRGVPLGCWAIEDALRGSRVWLYKPRHECQRLGIPRRGARA
jgi:hypothetical protein